MSRGRVTAKRKHQDSDGFRVEVQIEESDLSSYWQSIMECQDEDEADRAFEFVKIGAGKEGRPLLARIDIRSPVPPTLNEWQRMHYRKRAQFKSDYHTIAWAARNESGTKQVVGHKVHLAVRRYSSRAADHDNAVGGMKPLIDGIVSAGLAVDDSPKWMSMELTQEKAKPGRMRVVVEVYDAGEVG